MKKYNIVYADPAWSYDDKSLNRGGAERHYRTMSIEDIKALPLAQSFKLPQMLMGQIAQNRCYRQ